MKKLISFVAFLIVMNATYAGPVTDPENSKSKEDVTIAKILVGDEGKYKLTYVSQSKKPVRILLRGKWGLVIFKETIGKQAFSRVYDLKNLDPGKYCFEVYSGKKVLAQDIKLVKSPNYPLYVKLDQIEESKRFNLSVAGVKEGPVGVHIYDKKENLIYSESLTRDKNFKRTYNLEEVNSNGARMVISNNGQLVSKRLF